MSISVRSLTKAVAVSAAAILLLAASAVAQDAKGEFTLTKEVRWGNITLAPGNYVYSLEHHASEILIVRPAAGGAGYVMMAASVSRPHPASSDSLQLERRGDSWFVSSLTVHYLEEELRFNVPGSAATETGRTRIASVSNP